MDVCCRLLVVHGTVGASKYVLGRRTSYMNSVTLCIGLGEKAKCEGTKRALAGVYKKALLKFRIN